MVGSILIDEVGKIWPANSATLARRLGHVDARIDLATFAVCERGAIHIRSIEDGVRITLRPAAFSRVTLAGALQALNDIAPTRILLVTRSGGESHAPSSSPASSLSSSMPSSSPPDPPIEIKVPRYSVQRNLRNLATPPFAMVRPMVDLWKERRGELGEEVSGRDRRGRPRAPNGSRASDAALFIGSSPSISARGSRSIVRAKRC